MGDSVLVLFFLGGVALSVVTGVRWSLAGWLAARRWVSGRRS